MSHCHVAFEHLMKQVEQYEQRRSKRDNRPDWLCQLIDDVADMFDPATELARVGFDCVWTGQHWELAMFLGAVETVGGPLDGAVQEVTFEFDLLGLIDRFDRVDRLAWKRSEQADSESKAEEKNHRFQAAGTVGGEPIEVTILSTPPQNCGPAMRAYEDGRLETV